MREDIANSFLDIALVSNDTTNTFISTIKVVIIRPHKNSSENLKSRYSFHVFSTFLIKHMDINRSMMDTKINTIIKK